MTAASSELRFWVDMTLECIRRDHTPAQSIGDQRGPFLTARALGLATATLHDAKALAESRPPLLGVAATPGLVGASSTIAAGAACARLLTERYPRQAFLIDPAYAMWLEMFNLGPAGSAAEVAGRAFGFAVHSNWGNDAVIAAMRSYVPNGQPYEHGAPPNEPNQGFAGSAWGTSTPLLATRVPFPKPPGRTGAGAVVATPHYLADFDKVVAKGINQRSAGTRTMDEEIIGIYWGYDGPAELGTPPRLYMQVVLQILDNFEASQRPAMSVDDELQVIAGVGIAIADAGVDAWHYKYSPDHMMWRPVLGVRNAVPGNGVAVPDWLPLGRPDTNRDGIGLTPDFPAYPSGHATFGAAAFQLLRLFLVHKGVAGFGATGVDNVDFDFVSDEFDGRNTDPRNRQPRALITRRYPNLWQAIVDNSISRVFLGVHWQFDGITTRDGATDKFGVPGNPAELGETGGVWLGAKIANQVALAMGIPQGVIDSSRM